ncbi:MAG: DegT/DnrJ/EryC1/StrS family aminotransferase [Nanoarchaeota archaeon]|nr:DegT/DnrJ/EryC1/StrS family aminotransferase [Nanoarchaeota archaeon]
MDKLPLVDLQAQYRGIKKEVDAAIQNILDTTQFIGGAALTQFEQRFAQYCGKKKSVGVSNGTSALYVALKMLGVGKGDEVITVPNTFIATSEVINELGASVKFVDVEADTALMNPELLKKAITPKTKVILPVHLYGQPCDMKAISDIATDKNVAIVEDAAQAHGARQNGKRVPVTDIGCFSFYPGKNLGAYGDAGAIVCGNEEFALKCERFVNHGRNPGEKYLHHTLGSNYRMDTLQAAVLDVKLKHLDSWTQKRRQTAKWYDGLLKGVKTITERKGNESVYHLYVIQSENRQGLLEHLHKQGIQAGVHYPVPLHMQPSYAYLGLKNGSFPVAEKLCSTCVSLPLYPELTREQVEFVAEQVMAFESSRP